VCSGADALHIAVLNWIQCREAVQVTERAWAQTPAPRQRNASRYLQWEQVAKWSPFGYARFTPAR